MTDGGDDDPECCFVRWSSGLGPKRAGEEGGGGFEGGGVGLEQGSTLDLVAVLAAGELLDVFAVLGGHEGLGNTEIQKKTLYKKLQKTYVYCILVQHVHVKYIFCFRINNVS